MGGFGNVGGFFFGGGAGNFFAGGVGGGGGFAGGGAGQVGGFIGLLQSLQQIRNFEQDLDQFEPSLADANSQLETLRTLTVDNAVQLFFNGDDLFGGIKTHNDCATGGGDFVFTVDDTKLLVGDNVIAVHGIWLSATIVAQGA